MISFLLGWICFGTAAWLFNVVMNWTNPFHRPNLLDLSIFLALGPISFAIWLLISLGVDRWLFEKKW